MIILINSMIETITLSSVKFHSLFWLKQLIATRENCRNLIFVFIMRYSDIIFERLLMIDNNARTYKKHGL